MISAIFVDRPRLAIVIALITTIAGALALYVIPIAQYPDIVPPQVQVTTTYPGANSSVVENTVAQPIEAQVVGVDKMIYMKSVSGDDGSYTLICSFELGTNPDINTVNVNNRVQVALSSLPPEVQRQGVSVKKKSSALLGVIALYSPKHTLDPLFLSNYATINLLDQIKSTPGVGDASLWGPQDYAMRAWVRTDRLTGLNLTTGDIINAIQAQNVQAAVGRIGARPISDEQQLQLNIQTTGRLNSVADFEKIVLRTNSDGSVLRLGDVARLELGAANLDRETLFNGGPAAVIAIYQAPGANAIATLKDVRAKLEAAEKRFPEDLAWKVTYDPTEFVTDTIHEVQKTLIEAFILVVIVVYLFLGSVRATLIPTFAVPVSLIGTFIVLLAIGYSANTVSLLAIVLAIGIVVDDAIVVVENVERVMEEHPELSPADATKQAMQEITAPIIAITLVLLSVFVPVAFIPGISGELFRQFAVTIAVSMFLSAINALTLSPALCAILLKRHHGPRRGLIGMVMRGIDHVRDGYGAAVARTLHFSIIGLVLVAVSIAGIIGLAKVTPTGFLPEDDQGALFVIAQLPGGASVVRTENVVRQAEAILKDEPAVEDVTSVIGLNFIDNYSQPNGAFLVVTLKPFAERKDRSQGASALIARLGPKFREIAGGTVVPLAPPPIIGLGSGGGFAYVLKDLRGGDPKALGQVMRGLVVAANQDPKLQRVFSTYSASNPSIYLDIDRDKVQVLGVKLSDLFQALQASLGGYFVNNMNLFGRTWQVQVQADAADRARVDDIYRINVRNDKGEMIALRSLVEVRPVIGPSAIIRYNNLRAVTVQGESGTGRFVRPSPQCHGSGGSPDAARRLCRRMDRHRISGETRRRKDDNHFGICAVVRVSLPRGALRELDYSCPCPAVGQRRRVRGLRCHRDRRPDPRSLRADRHGRADRSCRQKRYPDRRIREGEARTWRGTARSGDRREPLAIPAGDDDVIRLHPRSASACYCNRCIRACPSQCRNPGVWRNDLRVVHRYICDTAPVRDFPSAPRTLETICPASCR